jgi:hypothetical protein
MMKLPVIYPNPISHRATANKKALLKISRAGNSRSLLEG